MISEREQIIIFHIVSTYEYIARASSERIVEILEEESSLKNGNTPIRDMPNGEIVFENVGFSYVDDTDKECLSEISLRIPSGSTFGIIGATGSGKTSLVQLIPRLYDVTEGNVEPDGIRREISDRHSLSVSST